MIGSVFASYAILAIVLILFGALTATLAVWGMAIALLRPPRMTDGRAIWIHRRLSPADLGLPFEEVAFGVRDERTGDPIHIAGWWIPHPQTSGSSIVLLHDYGDAKIGAIAAAPYWLSMGLNILAIDLRAHGESGGANCTAGYWERHDLCQALDQLRAERPADTTRIFLLGTGLGALTALAAAALRADLAGVILREQAPDGSIARRENSPSPGTPGEGWGEGLLPDERERPHPIPLPEYRARAPERKFPAQRKPDDADPIFSSVHPNASLPCSTDVPPFPPSNTGETPVLQLPADARSAAIARLNQLGAPGAFFQRLAIALAERIGHCDFAAMDPAILLQRLQSPVFVMDSQSDPPDLSRFLASGELTSSAAT